MCGIFGIIQHQTGSIPDRKNLEASARFLEHRGPDSQGIFADVGIGLVHTRLSLIDLSERSNQPFWDRSGRYCLVYNGEIYNYKELRSELEKQGIRFQTTSDTEVLLESLIHEGIEVTLPRLEGMFAFALYDKRDNMVVLARDCFGIKPLYVYDSEDSFIFSSDIRAMRPWIAFEPDVLMISSYLQGFGVPTSACTFYKNVKIVFPGSVIKIRQGKPASYSFFASVSDFWDEDEVNELKRFSTKQIVDKVEERLFESVKMQLAADAPVGAFCSGGVDSSLVMAMASKLHNNLAVFHANVKGRCSEYEAAVTLAKHLKLDLRTVDVVDKDFVDLMPEIVANYQHPYTIHPNSVPFIKVSQLVHANSVKAVLSGEGSDECYLGYSRLVPKMSELIRQIPHRYYRKLRGILGDLIKGPPKRQGYQIVKESRNLVLGLHNRFETDVEYEDIRMQVERISRGKIRKEEVATLYELGFKIRTLLHRNDCLGMAASIEARFPFLDRRLVKLAVNMPYRCKIRFSPTALNKEHCFFRDKWVVRKVAERYLPNELSQRDKMGFPTSTQLRMHIPEILFQRSFIADLFGLSKREVRYLTEHANQELKLKLLHLCVWAHICLYHEPKDVIVGRLREYVTVKPELASYG